MPKALGGGREGALGILTQEDWHACTPGSWKIPVPMSAMAGSWVQGRSVLNSAPALGAGRASSDSRREGTWPDIQGLGRTVDSSRGTQCP